MEELSVAHLAIMRISNTNFCADAGTVSGGVRAFGMDEAASTISSL